MFYSFELEKYLESLLPARDELLLEMERLALKQTIPVVTPAVGIFLQQLVKLSGARAVLELGTAIGYSTIYLARGVCQNGGKVVTVDMNKGRMALAKEYIERAGLVEQVKFVTENLLNYLPQVNEQFDFVFVDAGKSEYPEYLALVVPLVAPGGLLVVDNVLFRGWVVPGSNYDAKYNRMVNSMRDFLQQLAKLPDFTLSALPFGDGLAIASRSKY